MTVDNLNRLTMVSGLWAMCVPAVRGGGGAVGGGGSPRTTRISLLLQSPKKDYTTNTLTAGLLQLTDHTELILDETAMQAGQLVEPGEENPLLRVPCPHRRDAV